MEPEKFTDHLHNSMVDYSSNALGTTTVSSTEGLWSQITNNSNNVYQSPYLRLDQRLDKLELDNKLLRLKVLGLEGKFTQEEITNIRKMLMSEDEASKTLADSIIENA